MKKIKKILPDKKTMKTVWHILIIAVCVGLLLFVVEVIWSSFRLPTINSIREANCDKKTDPMESCRCFGKLGYRSYFTTKVAICWGGLEDSCKGDDCYKSLKNTTFDNFLRYKFFSPYAKDDKNVFCNGDILVGADVLTFEPTNKPKFIALNNFTAKDRNFNYVGCKQVVINK